MSNVKINVHIRLDGDVVKLFKEKAKQEAASTRRSLISTYAQLSWNGANSRTTWII